jgi:preprotein translocase subunit SecA
MISSLIRKVMGSKNERELKRLWPVVAKINSLEPQMQALVRRSTTGQDGGVQRTLQQG